MKRMLNAKIALVTGGNSGGSSSIDLATLVWEKEVKMAQAEHVDALAMTHRTRIGERQCPTI